ncbi:MULTISPECIES: M20 family metallopeptidase [Inquilinus]|uniref:Succinyl-diaminopimelate desuccinylase n=1 Tax=Inquilinus ginsengisoli TaxID=363840 RepID=A0ABU1JJS9_9PROT|nr:M20 family metallopeptidase [Inquilinus ginsengisoli]MDR6288871.1 succinyl-diaminopimelate desuccinylase [Inquilinus ginsengisoli]
MSTSPAVELTRELIRRRSINPPGGEQPCAELAAGLLEAAGFAVARHDLARGRTNLVASLPGEGAPLCFTGHLDTVPLGAAPWTRDPFAAEIDGDRVYGRGSSDMKAGVAAMVVAAIGLASLPGRRAGLSLVLTAGEETGCDGARHLAGVAGALPQAGALVVGEPTANLPLIGHRGALWLRAAFHGVTAHGSMPEQGVNAVYKAARGVLRLAEHAFDTPRHIHLGGPSINVGTFAGGLNVNSVPDRAEIQVDIRTIPGQSNDAICREVEAVLGEGVELSRIVDVGAVATSPQDEWISGVFDLCERAIGQRIDPAGAAFFTDASVLAPAMGGIPVLILGPGEPTMAHKTDEYCLVPAIDAAVGLYTEIGRRWMGL